MDGVTVHGPDGNEYHFPEGTSKDAAVAYFKKKGIGASAAVPGGSNVDLNQMPAAPNITQAFRDAGIGTGGAQPEGFWKSLKEASPIPILTTPEEQKAFLIQTLKRGYENANMGPMGAFMPTTGEAAEAVSSVAPKVKREAVDTYRTAKAGNWPAAGAHAAGTLGYAAATAAAPFGGTMLAKSGEQFGEGNVAGGMGTATGVLLPFAVGGMAEGAGTAREFFTRDLAATSHDILNKTANQAKAKLWDAHNQVSGRVGKLINDISAADYQAGDPSIPVADLWSKVQDIAERYKATGKDTPKFAAASDAVSKRGPYLSWKELHDLKGEIDSGWAKAAEGSRDAGATNELRDSINKKLADRAAEVDRTAQYKAYNDLWSTLKKYEDTGALGKLLDAKNGAQFFDVLRDSSVKSELVRTFKDLSQFGLPQDFSSNLVKAHAPLHDYVSDPKTVSRIRIAMQHPWTIPAMAAGTAIGTASGVPMGGFIGGSLTGAGAVAAARRVGAARAVSELGRPSLAGEMESSAKVKPVGTGERPTATPPKAGAVNRDEMISALKSLGYSKAEATDRAMQGIAEHPTDFNAALNRAMKGAEAAPAKAKEIQTIKSASGGSQNASPYEPRKSMIKPGPKSDVPKGGETASILDEIRRFEKAQPGRPKEKPGPMDAKSVASHNDAFDQAKREWMQANPGKDPANHMSEIARRAEFLRKGK